MFLSGFEFEMVIKAEARSPFVRLEYFKLVAEGNLFANMDLLVEATHAFTGKWEQNIGPKVRLGSITIPTPIPVVIIPKVWMEVEASAKLVVEGSAKIGFDYTQYVRIGTMYRAAWNQFRTLNKQSSKFTYHPFTATFKGSAEVYVIAKPTLSFEVYGSLPLIMQPNLFLGVDLASGAGSGCSQVLSPHYQIWYATGMKFKIAEIQWAFFGYEIKIDGGVLPVEKLKMLTNKKVSVAYILRGRYCSKLNGRGRSMNGLLDVRTSTLREGWFLVARCLLLPYVA